MAFGRAILEICKLTDGQADRHTHRNTLLPYRGRSNQSKTMQSTVTKIATDLRLSADGSAVRTSLMADGG